MNDAGVNGADAVKLNGVGPSGTESFTIVIDPCWVFTNVQTTLSPAVKVIAT